MTYITWQRLKANCLRFVTSTNVGFLLFFALSNVASAQTQNNVSYGWNLLGNGVNSQIAVSSTFGNAANVTSVWKWDASTSNWAFYTPSISDGGAAYAASKGYAALTAINPGEGYWVNAKVAFSLPGSMSAVYSASNYLPTSPTALLPGWSLIGIGDGISASAFNSSLSPTAPTPGSIPLNVTTIWAWDAANAAWYFYSPKLDSEGSLSSYITSKGYEDFKSNSVLLKDGVGFWVNNPATGLNAVTGTISGLASGTSVTLSNAGLSQTIGYNGTFSFTISTGSSYNIAISKQPVGQVCTVTNGVGLAVTQNVSGVSVDCVANKTNYTIGGTVTGLASGTQLTLLNNGADTKVVTANGAFTFSKAIANGGTYAVTVSAKPSGQTCSVTNGTGTVATSVSNVQVNCVPVVPVPQPQTITFTLPAAISLGATQQLSATASSGLAVSYSASPSSVCTISGNTLKGVGLGTCTVTASQAGDSTYAAASAITATTSISTNQISWAAWTKWNGSVATAQVQSGSGTITASMTSSSGIIGIQINNGDSSNNNVPHSYDTNGGVDYWGPELGLFYSVNKPSNTDLVQFDLPGTRTLTFSSNIGDLYLAMLSYNGNVVQFTQDFEIITNTNNGVWGSGSIEKRTVVVNGVTYYQMVAISGDAGGLLKFTRVGTNFSWSEREQEYWHGFTFGTSASTLNTITGTISGLASGTSVTLANAGISQTIGNNGTFSFTVPTGSNYSIAVSNQPTGQVCTVTKGMGLAVTQNVSGVSVDCVANKTNYTIGGTVSGLATGQRVTLLNNGGDALVISANGAFTFPTTMVSGAAYAATVGTQPTGGICTVSNGSGTTNGSIAMITVICSFSTSLKLGTVSGVNLNLIAPISVAGNTFYFLDQDGNGIGSCGGGDSVDHIILNNLFNAGKPTTATANTVLVQGYSLSLATQADIFSIRTAYNYKPPPGWWGDNTTNLPTYNCVFSTADLVRMWSTTVGVHYNTYMGSDTGPADNPTGNGVFTNLYDGYGYNGIVAVKVVAPATATK